MIFVRWLNLSNTKGGLGDWGIQVTRYYMKPQPMSNDKVKKLKVSDKLKNVNKVQVKMADPGKFGFTPKPIITKKQELVTLNSEELKNIQVGDEILIYRQATDQIHHVVVTTFTNNSLKFRVRNDKIYAEFDMKTGISTSKEWVACKHVEIKAKTFSYFMPYEKLGKIINSKMHDQQLYTVCKDEFINKIITPELLTNYQRLSKQQYHQILEPHFRFIRDDKNHPYATICQLTIITPSQRIDRATGIAVCSEKDQFNRQIGKQLAYKRAIIALNSKQNSYKINRTDSDRTYELMAQDYDYKSFYEEGL